jgi:hypothetical protein
LKFERTIAQLTVSAENCEANAKAFKSSGNQAEADNSAQNAEEYRRAIKLLETM